MPYIFLTLQVIRLTAISERDGPKLDSHYTGFGPVHNALFELEQLPAPDTSAAPRDKPDEAESAAPTTASRPLTDGVSSAVSLLARLLDATSESCVFARGALAWVCVRNSARVMWNALSSGWASPFLFGSYTDPHAGLSGSDAPIPAAGGDATPAAAQLDWRPLWRCGMVVLDLLESIGRQRIETYFCQGVPAGVSTADDDGGAGGGHSGIACVS